MQLKTTLSPLRHVKRPMGGPTARNSEPTGRDGACADPVPARAIAILDIHRVNDDIQQETGRVDQNVPLATLELLARVIARRVAPLTL